ncbi:polysaccharide biosynthesis tyrosine autokinase [Saccharopolyspora sp. HNM0983]|uniref:non-specific protein-tyrosine kinase n=1 Tax=Saccharopolyspora montiporae TaxID=2781240 RepID=A0A929G244_9PSEU|nr:polysaccharide biosynthesis tyrosine autokinase [Saccharopolyspora sp. HNM0983]MBE9376492.1 polysaccharide biosynthesis tyrosine autokinase [Saccharopolyspora sp. HNM0983]
MTWSDHLRVVRERWRFLVAGLLLGLVAASAGLFLVPPKYTAEVAVYVSARAPDDAVAAYQGNLLSEQKVKSYVQLIRNGTVARDVLRELELPESADSLSRRTAVTSEPDTVLLSIEVTDPDPLQARRIADNTASSFTGLVSRLESGPRQQPDVLAEVVEPATAEGVPVSPRPLPWAATGLLAGLVLGYAAALLRHLTDTSLRTPEQLAELVDAPQLGITAANPQADSAPLVVHAAPHSACAEHYRTLRTNLQFVDVDSHRKTVVVTSPGIAEGKTTTVVNLGVALARAGVGVVLVDADLRRPAVADCLGLEGAVGVTSVLSGRAALGEALQSWGGELDVLAGGQIAPNPSELLHSSRMSELLDALRSRYEMVLLDAPPLLPVTDAAVLTAACDGAVLVGRYKSTSRSDVRAAAAALDRVSARVLGTVLSVAPQPARSYGYYGYHGYRLQESPGRGAAPVLRAERPEPAEAVTSD